MKTGRCAIPIAIGLPLWLAACGPTVIVGSEPWFGDRGRADLRGRATFDLSCGEQELTFRPLGGQAAPYEIVGVEGCGRKATYVFHDWKWIMNDVTTSPAEKGSATGKPTPG